ncbi:ATP-binding protein [Thauera sp. SDU_THAU2]|uniref:ATP-binding protein n=1 Tax=Thauera sp. SDU_THAU2 TaxID=3136633 RepID=UPI00311E9881
MSSPPADVFDVVLPCRPYPGLRPFEKHEWPIFFGRERMADAVVAQLIDRRLLVVHGDSGCGKSSLVRAAVLPRLEQESARGGLSWRTCAMTPGEAPLWNLALALAELDGGKEERALEIRRALNFGRDAPETIATLLRRDSADHLCILIDQFEELFDFAHRHGPEEAQLLADFLVGLFETPPAGLYAVLTMRSEFLGACARFEGFAEAVNRAQYLLPRMTHDDLLRAIREPAQLFGGEVSMALAERLIHDAGGRQDQLPLIQHGLMLLHRDHVELSGHADGAGWLLDSDAYDGSSGLAGLLSRHADDVMDKAQAFFGERAGEVRVVEDVFRALTEINAEGQAIRRPRSFADLAAIAGCGEAELQHVLKPFRVDGASLLRPYGEAPIAADERVDISHEALIRCWERLADPGNGWLVREFRNGLVWRALLVQADSFERDPSNVLGPTTTGERLAWIKRRNPVWAERYGGGWPRVKRLLAASAEARDREQAAQAAARKREQRVRTLSWGIAALVLLVTVISTAVVFAWNESMAAKAAQASEAAARASEAEQHARTEALLAEARATIDALDMVQQKLDRAASATGDEQLAETLNQAQKELSTQVYKLNKQTMPR